MAYYKGPKSDHFDGTQFFNPWNPRTQTWVDVLKWKWTSSRKPWPKQVPYSFSGCNLSKIEDSKIRVSFVGHSTVLLQTEGLNILTDPVWSDKIGPYKLFKIPRVIAPGIPFECLPKIDLVLISHNHYDHLDDVTVQKLWLRDKPLIIAPLGNDAVIHRYNPNIQVKTLDWNESIRINNQLNLHLEPTQHWSARGLRDADQALWGAFVLETPSGNIYFGGDSGYDQRLYQNTKKKFKSFRFAILPIGCYEPRWFTRYMHMSPHEAVLAFHDLGAPVSMAIHYETFRLADEGYHDCVAGLNEAKIAHCIPQDQFRALKVGQSWELI